LKAGAVVLSLPLRVGVGVILLPVTVLAQLGSWIARGGGRGADHPEKVTWTASTGTTHRFARYDARILVYGNTDGVIRRAVKVRQKLDGGTNVVDGSHWLHGGQPCEREFSGLTLASRLDLASHGTAGLWGATDTRTGLDAAMLADRLHAGGLRKVGVINVASCNAGASSFLEDLGAELHARNIEFGWIAGASAATGETRMPGRIGSRAFTWSAIVLPWKQVAGLFQPLALNRKVLEGNAHVDFKGTVFNSRKNPLRVASQYAPWR
jgi:hypothetical protein